MKKFVLGIVSMFLLTILGACSSDDDTTTPEEETARMSIKLTDAPGDYDAVFIDVQDVVVKYNGEDNEVNIGEVNAGVYDLLELTGGVSVLLVDDELPAGDISQIRLILGSNNTIVVNGETFPLQTPSSQQSGLKINVNETLEGGVFYEFILDFDVDKSIVEQGNGGYLLKPVIRASTEAETGAMTGAVLPLGIQTLVTAENATTEISAFTNEAGVFVLSGVPAGTYTVTYEADVALGFPPVVVTNVGVEIGAVTELDTVVFE
ncbi:carboxypeptidase family protein [Marinirhabdus gelatinilytica]|uniref:Carboxypeptidase family protein n=2 Tax=Marinirhabdus gelatinilytica TaxID=1703343 RepID=A0A370QJT3_9FLAO|nr:carboxypeptidase family protein [Marinirhabdus gelatinilytica]